MTAHAKRSTPSSFLSFLPSLKMLQKIPTTVEDTRATPAVDAETPSPCSSPIPSRVPLASVVAAVRDADEGVHDLEGPGTSTVPARSISFNAGVDGRAIFRGRGRKTGDGGGIDEHGLVQSDMKRRRSSGWFRRLTSSFQSSRERSASDELLERAQSPPPEVVSYGGDSDAEESAAGGVSRVPAEVSVTPILSTKAAEVVSSSTTPVTTAVSSATASEERSLFAPDRVVVPERGDTPPSEGPSQPSSERSSEQSSKQSAERSSGKSSGQSSEQLNQSVGSASGEAEGRVVGPVVVGLEAVAERVAGLGEGGGVSRVVGGRGGGGGRTETDEEESDDETGSYTTEGFGSDDAGDLWEGGRATGLLNRVAGDGRGDEGRGNGAVRGDNSRSGAGGAGEGAGAAGTLGEAAPIDAAGEPATGVARGSGEAEAVMDPLERHPAGVKNDRPFAFGSEEAASAASDGAGHELFEIEAVTPPRNGGKLSEAAVNGGGGGGGGGDENACRSGGCRVGDNRKIASGTGTKNASNGGTAVERTRRTRLGSILAAPMTPTSPLGSAATARSMPPPAPPSTLPFLPDSALDSPIPTVLAEVAQSLFSPPKPNLSPAISEDSNKESPRAWRMSWWARASDRHQPPPPVCATGGDDDGTVVAGSSVAAALAAATAGGEEAASAVRPGGEFVPAFSGGDAPAPSAVDRGGGGGAGGGAGKTQGANGVEAAAVAAAVAAERRTRNRVRRTGRLGKPWLLAETLVNVETRALESACRYLDVAGLARATGVCRAWGKRLGGEAGAREWIRCVRLADGVPEGCRAGFYLHVLFDQPSWMPKVRVFGVGVGLGVDVGAGVGNFGVGVGVSVRGVGMVLMPFVVDETAPTAF